MEKSDNQVLLHHLKPGTLLNHRYRVDGVLGEGGFGITYVGLDTMLDMKVAVKEYYPHGYANRNNESSTEVTISTGKQSEFFEKGKEKFLKEARVLGRFSGVPGIVNVHDFFRENETAYIVMEYLNGITLKEYVKRHGVMPADELCALMAPLLKSLDEIHKAGLIHRDISPDNIMLMPDHSLKLMDFGAARDVSAAGQKSLSVMLKPGYAPEEQYRSRGHQGPWTDIYAICATMYKCITGVTPDDSMQRVFEDELRPPSQLGIKLEKYQEDAIMKGLSVLQKDRFSSAVLLCEALMGKRAKGTTEDGKDGTDDVRTVFISNDFGEKTLNSQDVTRMGGGDAADARTAVHEPDARTVMQDAAEGSGNDADARTVMQTAAADDADTRTVVQADDADARTVMQDAAEGDKSGADTRTVAMAGVAADGQNDADARTVMQIAPADDADTRTVAMAGVSVGGQSDPDERTVMQDAAARDEAARGTQVLAAAKKPSEAAPAQPVTPVQEPAASEQPVTPAQEPAVPAQPVTPVPVQPSEAPTTEPVAPVQEPAPPKQKKQKQPKQSQKQELASPKQSQQQDPPAQKRSFKIPAIIIGSAAALCLIIVAAVIFLKAFSNVKIAGESYAKDVHFITFDDKTLTKDDMEALKKLKKLRNLTFYGCEFEEGATDVLAELSDLSKLYMEDCSGSIDVSALPGESAGTLYTLGMVNCGLTDEDLRWERSFDALVELNVSNNPELTTLDFVSVMPSLTSLQAGYCAITSMDALSQWPSLELLKLPYNAISDIQAISQLEELTVLDLSGQGVSEEAGTNEGALLDSVKLLAGNEKLEELYMNNCAVTSLEPLSRLIYLKRVCFDNNELEDLSGLENCTQLEVVSARGNHLKEISGIRKSTQTIQKLMLSDNELSGAFAELLAEDGEQISQTKAGALRWPSLKVLELYGNALTQVSGFADSLELRYLNLSWNQISDIQTFQNCENLQYAYFFNNQIEDLTPLKAATGMRELDLSANPISSLEPLSGMEELQVLLLFNVGEVPVTGVKGGEIGFEYYSGLGLEAIKEGFYRYYLPKPALDEQVYVENTLPGLGYVSEVVVDASETTKYRRKNAAAYAGIEEFRLTDGGDLTEQ